MAGESPVKIREADRKFLARLDCSSPTVMQDGFLTAETLDALSPLMPALRNVPDRTRVTPGELLSLLTVESLCLMIERHLPA